MEPTPRPRVLVADDLDPQAVERLRAAGLEVEVRIGLGPAELEASIAPFDGLLVRSATRVTASLLAAAPRLRVVGRAGVGVDNVDLDAATRRGVLVVNAPGGSSVAVAELALGLALSLLRHLPAATASLKAGRWEKKRFQGRELAGRTLGIVGIGNVGSALASRALAMGMKLVAYDPFITPEAAARMGARLVALDDLWGEADVISLHVPLTDQTRGLVDRRVLARMRPGAILLNCARGGLVDEAALAEALAAGRLAGAAFDVFDREPPPADHPLLALDNFLCTPHLGGSTEEAQSAVALSIAEKVAAFLVDGVVSGAVNAPGLPRELLDRLGAYLPLAEKLGLLAAQLASGAVSEVEVEVAGELAASPTRPLSSRALTGLLRGFLDVPVNEVNAPAVARERGIALREVRSGEPQDYASLVTVRLRGQGEEVRVAGTVYGKGDARVVRIGDFRLEGVPEGAAILCENLDVPGVVGNLGNALGEAGINIARISLSRREGGGTALSFLNVDQAPTPGVLERIRSLPAVRWARSVVL